MWCVRHTASPGITLHTPNISCRRNPARLTPVALTYIYIPLHFRYTVRLPGVTPTSYDWRARATRTSIFVAMEEAWISWVPRCDLCQNTSNVNAVRSYSGLHRGMSMPILSLHDTVRVYYSLSAPRRKQIHQYLQHSQYCSFFRISWVEGLLCVWLFHTTHLQFLVTHRPLAQPIPMSMACGNVRRFQEIPITSCQLLSHKLPRQTSAIVTAVQQLGDLSISYR